MCYSKVMSIRKDRREAAIERMADYVLSEGLAGATLRPLAAAAGTSDRMLLYYFTDKDELLTAILENIGDRLLGELSGSIAIAPPRSFARLLEEVWTVLGSARHRPYMNIWYDLASRAARNRQPFRQAAGVIADSYLAWVEERLAPESDGTRSGSASLFLATVQGMYLIDAVGRPAIASGAMTALSLQRRG
jgi:AcrR family transcriptional regulator